MEQICIALICLNSPARMRTRLEGMKSPLAGGGGDGDGERRRAACIDVVDDTGWRWLIAVRER
jgi:hypothetical protein